MGVINLHKIQIKNFGPIKDFKADIKDCFVFIGPQGSGKSTISKAIYFFKSLKNDMLKYFIESIEKEEKITGIEPYEKIIINKFIEYWGAYDSYKGVTLKYEYKNNCFITIKADKDSDKYITPLINVEFLKKYNKIMDIVNNYIIKEKNSDALVVKSQKGVFIENIKSEIEILFDDNSELLFIPAGRSLAATISEQLSELKSKNIDIFIKEFIDKITEYKRTFTVSIDEIVIKKEKTTGTIVNKELINLAKNIMTNIIKGEFRVENNEEKIIIQNGKDKKKIKLNYSSSGQQESIWILNILTLLLIENRRTFIVIEEPEAHLHPEAQKQVVEMIFLIANINNNQVIITTHSPYILASINNLMYAHKVGEKDKRVEEIIDRNLWLNHIKMETYFIDSGKAEDIIDREYQMIRNEKIDSVSSIINEEYDFLYNLEEE